MANRDPLKSDSSQREERVRNISRKSALKTTIKKYEAALVNDPSNALPTRKGIQALDQAATNGVIHKNTAARKKSRLSKRLANNA